jgi:hypothetical protein
MVLTPLVLMIALAASPAELAPPGAAHFQHSNDDITSYDTALRPSQVDAFLRKALAARGWTAGDSVNYGTTVVVDFRKGAGRVTIAPVQPGKTHVTVSLVE